MAEGQAGAAVGGGTVSGAQTDTLNITGLTSSDLGTYDVVVQNDCGSTTSTACVLSLAGTSLVSSAIAVSGPNLVFNLATQPGATLTLESAPTASGPWAKVTNLTAPASGSVPVSQPLAPAAAWFYRTVYPPY